MLLTVLLNITIIVAILHSLFLQPTFVALCQLMYIFRLLIKNVKITNVHIARTHAVAWETGRVPGL